MINIYFSFYTKDFHHIYSELRGLRNENIRLWVTKDFLRKTNTSVSSDVSIIENGISLNQKVCYVEWHCEKYYGECLQDRYKYMYERIREDDIWIIIDDEPHEKDIISIFIEDPNDISLPNEWRKATCFYDLDKLLSFCLEKDAFKFVLCEGPRFSKAKDINPVKGAIVYKEKDTGYLWYKDTFHKVFGTQKPAHCEVFDSTGKNHLGEAPFSTGILDKSKKDETKLPIR